MSGTEYRDILEAEVRVLTEAELATWQRERGAKVMETGGRYWCETSPGFYQGTHWCAAVRASEARPPTRIRWAYRIALRPEDSHAANARFPLVILRNLAEYDESCLSRSARYNLNKARRRVRVVQLTEPGLLREQGYDVYLSASQRVGRDRVLSPREYHDRVDRFVREPRRLVAAALFGERLAGYWESFAVDGIAYVWNVHVATEFADTNASIGLQFAALQAYRRSGLVHTVVNGMDTPEREGLMSFKIRLGFAVERLPARMWMLPPAKLALRRMRPWPHYRLTGDPPRDYRAGE